MVRRPHAPTSPSTPPSGTSQAYKLLYLACSSLFLNMVGQSLDIELVCISTMEEDITNIRKGKKIVVVRHREVTKHLAKGSTLTAGYYTNKN